MSVLRENSMIHISIWECGQPYSQDEKLYLNLKEFRGEFFEKKKLPPF